VAKPGLPSLHGRRFRSVEDVAGGDVGRGTVFEYRQDGDLVHATYSGGAVRRGFLVGTRDGDELRFRYVQLRSDGTAASGRCRSRLSRLADGRLRLDESWEWESQDGSGTSAVEEVVPAGPAPQPTAPVRGSCLCGGVRFEVTRAFRRAGYCHCSRCRKHSGAGALAQGRVPGEGFRLVAGAELLRTYRPAPDAAAKVFCSVCGSSLFGGDWPHGDEISIRLGALDDDPGVRPQDRAFTASAASWEEIPEDGLQRYPGARTRR
jgi:hypothetical protein